MHDTVIRGGTVVDGTGAPAFVADIAIDNGHITIVGAVPDKGRTEIDASGLHVTPGFVDVVVVGLVVGLVVADVVVRGGDWSDPVVFGATVSGVRPVSAP